MPVMGQKDLPSVARERGRRGSSRLGRSNDANGKGEAELEGVVEHDLDPVGALLLELHVRKDGHLGEVVLHRAQFDIALAGGDHARVVGKEEAVGGTEVAHSAAPAREEKKLLGGHGQGGDRDPTEDTDEQKAAVGLLPNVLAEKAGLEIGGNGFAHEVTVRPQDEARVCPPSSHMEAAQGDPRLFMFDFGPGQSTFAAMRAKVQRAAAVFAALVILFSTGCTTDTGAPSPGVKVDSEPPGVVLSINGKEVGRTPYMWKSPPAGKTLLQFVCEGYEPLDRVVNVDPSALADVVVKLQRLQGLVLFQSTPTGAEVTVNGSFKGKAPLLSTDLPSGKHKVVFRIEGYDPREMDLEIVDRAPQVCAMNMRSIHATVRVESVPPGAAVMLDGIHKGQTPCTVEDVLIGDHKLKVVREGYKDFETDLRLAQTGTFPVTVKLEERFAALDVVSSPADARVTLNEEFKGRTPLQISGLRDGAYTVTIEKTGYDKITRQVEIRRNQDAKLDISLEKGNGLLSLSVSPSGASIVVDGELKGSSVEGPFTLEMPPGAYKVNVNKAGYRPITFSMVVTARKTVSRDVSLQKIWVKDTMVVLRKDQRVREGMLVAKYPNGTIRVETAVGVFEEYSADEVQSVTPIKAP